MKNAFWFMCNQVDSGAASLQIEEIEHYREKAEETRRQRGAQQAGKGKRREENISDGDRHSFVLYVRLVQFHEGQKQKNQTHYNLLDGALKSTQASRFTNK